MHGAPPLGFDERAVHECIGHKGIPGIDEGPELMLDPAGLVLHGIDGVRESRDSIPRDPPRLQSFDVSACR